MAILNHTNDPSIEVENRFKELLPNGRKQCWSIYSGAAKWDRKTTLAKLNQWFLEELKTQFLEYTDENINSYLSGAPIDRVGMETESSSTEWMNNVITEHVSDPTIVPGRQYTHWLRKVSDDASEREQHFRSNALKAIQNTREMHFQREVFKETQQTAHQAAITADRAATAATWSARAAIITAVAAIVEIFIR